MSSKSGRVKPKTVKLIFLLLRCARTVKKAVSFYLIKATCSSGVTCQLVDCLTEPAKIYKKLSKCVGLIENGHHNYLIECNMFSPKYSQNIDHLALSKNHNNHQIRQWQTSLYHNPTSRKGR